MALSRDRFPKSKKQKRLPRRCEGESVARPLLSFLNPRKDFRLERTDRGVVKRDFVTHEPRSNLHEVVRGLKRLDEMRRKIDSRSPPHEQMPARRLLKKHAEILSARLGKYATRPGIAVNETFLVGVRGSGEPLEVRGMWEGKDFYKWVDQSTGQESFNLEEWRGYFALKEIINRRWLWRLRICVGCRKHWLWAKARNQECCSARCRKVKSRSQEAKHQRKANRKFRLRKIGK